MENHFLIPNHPWTRGFVFSIWQTSGEPLYSREMILPKGVVDIIFNFSDSGVDQIRNENDKVTLPHCFINGYNTNPVLLSKPGHQSFFGIRFNPVAIRYLLGISPGELKNKSLDLSLIDKSLESLWYRMAEMDNFSDRVDGFIRWIYRSTLYKTYQDEALKDFLYNEQTSEISVMALSKDLKISSRHLSRKLKALTGMNTEEILLYRKYLHALKLMHGSILSLTEIAYACYFYDQSHFIRTFRLFTKMAPREYLKKKSQLPGHIFI